jgi:hypothetical protein
MMTGAPPPSPIFHRIVTAASILDERHALHNSLTVQVALLHLLPILKL